MAATDSDGSRRPWLTRNVKVLSAVSLAQDTASELMYPLLPILLTTTLGAPAAVVGLVEGVAEGVAAALKYLSGRWSDRFGRKPAVTAGYGLAALGKVIIAAAASWPVVLVGRVTDRIGKGIRGAPRDALLAEGVPPDAVGRVFGFHRAADTLGAVIGPLLGLAILTAIGQRRGCGPVDRGDPRTDQRRPRQLHAGVPDPGVAARRTGTGQVSARHRSGAGARAPAPAGARPGDGAGALRAGQLPRCADPPARQRARLQRRAGRRRLRPVEPGQRRSRLPSGIAERPVATVARVRAGAGLLRHRLHRPRAG